MHVFRTVFPGRPIYRFRDISWPTPLPDHAVPEYFLWGYVTSKVYKIHPANIDGVKQRIVECILRDPSGSYATCYNSISSGL